MMYLVVGILVILILMFITKTASRAFSRDRDTGLNTAHAQDFEYESRKKYVSQVKALCI